MTKTRSMTTCAVLIALSTVLMLVSKLIPSMPWGGSVTLCSMVPLILIPLICGTKWGIFSGVVYALIQMLSGFYPPPTQTVPDFVLVVLLDYLLAFGVLGCAGIFFRLFGKGRIALPLCGIAVTLLRYLCHILSGILIWGVYADEGQTVLAYSILYNGSYMIPEIILTAAALALLSGFLLRRVIPRSSR